MRARTINGLLAFWLYLSVFLWHHTRFQLENDWLVAFGVMFVAMVAIAVAPRARYLTVALGAWLVATALLTLPSGAAFTSIHNLVVGVALCGFALVRDAGRPRFKPYEGPAEPYGPSVDTVISSAHA